VHNSAALIHAIITHTLGNSLKPPQKSR
jgi:hypothetical protein